MSILSLIATTLIVGAEPTGAPLQELVDRWNGACQSTEELSAECNGLAAEIELGLYGLLRKLALNREPLDREVLRAAAQSNLPMLAKLGVSLLGEPRSQADADALLYAVDHPVLAVRYIAARNLGNAKDPTWQSMQQWWTGWTLAPSANSPEESLIPDPRPEPGAFLMKSFNQLTYHYYGSDAQSAMFTTTEAAESVLKRFGANKRVLDSADAMQQQLDALLPEMESVQKEMEAAGAAGNMDRLNIAMKRYEVLSNKMLISHVPSNPLAPSHTVILSEDKAAKRATCTVKIERDPKLNRTVLVFWREGGWRK
jgi:hypothetical protein